MTWSIIARDDITGEIGIAVATKFFAVGARVPFIEVGAGALATQALMNPLYGRAGLALLRQGMPAPEVLRHLVEADAGREHRQLHIMDVAGGSYRQRLRRLVRAPDRRQVLGRRQHARRAAGDRGDGTGLCRQ
jgi:uncharacterized Ntn-hydrolase superfamily protein